MVADRRLPAHVAVLIGASTAAYAVSLAGMAALQSSADQALIEERAPTDATAARLKTEHDRLQAEIDRSIAVYSASATRFEAVAVGLDSLDRSLKAYAGRMERVTGAARALPGRVSLPAVSRTTTSRPKPATSASTGASGG